MFEIDFQKPLRVHFIGIGGISMSALARILLSEGFRVSGSDMKQSALTDELAAEGAVICIGQRAENISDDIELVIYTAAISADNPELAEVKRRQIPMLTRAQLLGQMMKNYPVPIAIAGTHGKTTTTSMVSEMLMAADADPTLTIGGILDSIGGNLRIGKSDYFVAEACEYTNSFLEFFPRISIILNIEEDHMDFFHDIDEIRSSFRRFAALLPADGSLIINGEIPDTDALLEGLPCSVIRYGSTAEFDYYPSDISYDELGRASYTLHHKTADGEESFPVSLGVVGLHNVCNSLAALALSDLLGLPRESSLAALRSFSGTERRFEKKGEIGGVTIMDDYAHHPTEIRATLNAAKNYPHKTLWCIFQPHTYSRTKAFLNDFADALLLADRVILCDIYAAREKNTLGISSRDLQAAIREKGGNAEYFSYFDDVETFILEHAVPGDLVLTMGAGDVYRIGEKLLGK